MHRLWLAAFLLFSLPAQAGQLRMAMVTSLEASGLAPRLIETMQHDTGIAPHVIITGSGRALFLLARGDVDLVMTHDPQGEQALIHAGKASARHQIMQNRFVLAGPPDDPANVANAPDPVAALQRIAAAQAPFISRGDLSGTHRKEQSLWPTPPQGDWYRPIGSGMAASIRMMEQLGGYSLVDEASFARLGTQARLRAFGFDRDPRMINIYSVLLPINPKQQAVQVADWLQSDAAQQIIAAFVINSQPVYQPASAGAGLPARP